MITYFTDGSCSPNPGPGGFAVIKQDEWVIVGHEDMTTNIRMEARAIIAALKDVGGEKCQIFTDSEFWVNVLTKWASTWERNGWVKRGGEIRNLEVVKEVYWLYKQSSAKVMWVRGHNGTMQNELADSWANRAREERLVGKFIIK